ncbi:MAG: transglycosylase domain-containing protein, partial [Microcystaceae cyanobacterium]
MVFKQFTHQLKKKTSQVLHHLAESLEKAPDHSPTVLTPEPIVETENPELAHTMVEPRAVVQTSVVQASTVEPQLEPVLEGRGAIALKEKEVSTERVRIRVSATGVGLETSESATVIPEDLTPKIPKKRRARRAPQAPNFVKKVGQTFAPVGSGLQKFYRHPRFWLMLGLGLGATTGTIAYFWATHTLEQLTKENIAAIATYSPPGTITIKASNGNTLQEIGPVSHDKLKVGAIPPNIQNAFIASEDRRFNEHRGVDFQGIARAAFSNVQAGEVKQGGSTITQQLARLVFLSQDRSFERKIREFRLAQKIEEKFTKPQILERYLNLVYLGSGAYGVSDAAWAYFSKKPEQLTITEAATLAGIVPAPSVYSPLENKDLATRQRNEVLRKMQDAGLITEAEKIAAIAEPLVIKPSPLKRFERKAPYFNDYVLQELPKLVPDRELKKGGVTVVTTLNYPWQEA